MKKYSSFSRFLALCGIISLSCTTLYSSVEAAGGAYRIRIIMTNTPVANEPVDITIQAVDRGDMIVTDYTGSVIISTSNTGDLVPSPGKAIVFSGSDSGQKIFSKGVTFVKPGKQMLYVSDTKANMGGEIMVDVSTGTLIKMPGGSSGSTILINADGTSAVATGATITKTGAETTSSGTLDAEISKINNSLKEVIDLNAASTIPNNVTYTAWELMHRTPMLAGFMWAGEIAKFITPQMFIGTPFDINGGYVGGSNPNAATFEEDATTYEECIVRESYFSFGLGDRMEATDLKELKSIAKVCAQEFYGPYFDGKSYTTREEFLMMMFTLFGEDIGFGGEFDEDGKYIEAGDGIDSGFSNVSKKAWYSPYLWLAKEIGIIDSADKKWEAGKGISDKEAVEMLSGYTAYRMDFEGDTLDRGSVVTDQFKYNISFINDTSLTIRVQ